jgi:nitrite reductase/ring-hydroxylating ferredoxin subunit
MKYNVMKKVKPDEFAKQREELPVYSQLKGLDFPVIKFSEQKSVLYKKCLHRGVLFANGYAAGENIICGFHGWYCRYDPGVREYNKNIKALYSFYTEVI